MMSDVLRKKVDARGRHQRAQGTLKGTIEALIRTEAPPTPQQQKALLAAGCVIRSIVGNVLSGVTDAARLEDLARLPFVRKIELSRLLSEESQRS